MHFLALGSAYGDAARSWAIRRTAPTIDAIKDGWLRLLRTPLRYSAVAVQSVVLTAVPRHVAADNYGSDIPHMHFNRIMLATAR